jgi:hypothetical protein
MMMQSQAALEALAEVSKIVKQIEDTVSSFRVFDFQIKSLTDGNDRVEKSVRDLSSKLVAFERTTYDALQKQKDENKLVLEGIEEEVKILDRTVDSKLSFLRGAFATISILGAFLYALLGWVGGAYIGKVDEAADFVKAMRTLGVEDHLRTYHSLEQREPSSGGSQ